MDFTRCWLCVGFILGPSPTDIGRLLAFVFSEVTGHSHEHLTREILEEFYTLC